MSPVLPREERDAIRARAEAAPDGFWYVDVHGGVWVDHSDGGGDSASGLTGPLPIWAGGAAEFITHARSDVPALLDALDAAEEENERHALANGGCVPADAYRDLAEHVAALRGRIEALHRPDEHGPGRCDKADCITSCRECGDDWPCATIRALGADEGERTGR